MGEMQNNEKEKKQDPVFDYRMLRLLVGIIAFALPIAVTLVSSKELPSISASYYTESRNIFVGMLFVVGAFLFAYNGHTVKQALFSKVASIAALLVALCPTSKTPDDDSIISYIHYGAAFILFAILAVFCFVFFQIHMKGAKGKKKKRRIIYYVCGVIISACILSLAVAKCIVDPDKLKAVLQASQRIV